MKTIKCEVWLLVDEDGDYVSSTDPDLLAEQYEESVGEIDKAQGLRRIKLTVEVPLPTVCELAGVVSEAGTARLTEGAVS